MKPPITKNISVDDLSKELPTTQRMRLHDDGYFYDREEFSFIEAKPLTTSTPRPSRSLPRNKERVSNLERRRSSTYGPRRKSVARPDYDSCQLTYDKLEDSPPSRRRSSARRSRTSTRDSTLEENRDSFYMHRRPSRRRSSATRSSSIRRSNHVPDFSSNRNSTPQSLANFLIDDLEERSSIPEAPPPPERRSTRAHRRSTRNSLFRPSGGRRRTSHRMPIPSSRQPDHSRSDDDADQKSHSFVDTLSSFPVALRWQLQEIINICKRS